jgi:hypothetical protein
MVLEEKTFKFKSLCMNLSDEVFSKFIKKKK